MADYDESKEHEGGQSTEITEVAEGYKEKPKKAAAPKKKAPAKKGGSK